MSNYAFIGKGVVKLDGRSVGNVTSVSMTFATDDKKVDNYMAVNGGTYASVSRPKDAKIALSLVDFSPENLNELFRGAVTTEDILKFPSQPFDATANPITGKKTTINPFVRFSPTISLEFNGVNEYNGNKMKVTVPQFKLGVPKNLNLIGDDFARLEVEGDIIGVYNETTGVMDWFSLEMIEAV